MIFTGSSCWDKTLFLNVARLNLYSKKLSMNLIFLMIGCYQYLIDLGKNLPKFNEINRVDDNLVQGCQSNVWLHAELLMIK